MSELRYALIVAVQSIRTHRLRSVITALAIVLGVLALVTVDAAAGAAEAAVVDRAILTNGLPATWAVSLPPSAQLIEVAARATDDIGRRIEGVGGAATLVLDGNGTLVVNGSQIQMGLVAVRGSLLAVRPLRIVEGRWPDPARGLEPELVINATAAEAGIRFGDEASLLFGQRAVPIKSSVVAVVEDGERDPIVYLQAAQLEWWRPTLGAALQARLLVHLPSDTSAGVALSLINDGLARSGLQGSSPTRLDDLSAQMVAIQTLRLAFLTVAFIGLVTGMLGILNIGLATLSDRVVELALRRSAGATKRSVVLLMVTESVLVGALAAITAAVVAYFLYPATSRMIFPDIAASEVSQFPLSSSLIGVGAGMLAGLLGGIVPAQKAAAMDIASIMRA
jgi:putative ABC transport system permease protein